VTGRRPRLLVLNQYYRPGVEATANLLAELCEELAHDHDVTVVTGRLHGHPDLPDEELLDGVRVIRAWSTAYERAELHLRAANYLTYLAASTVRALRSEQPDVVLCLTDPPMIGDVGLLVARRFGVPLVVVSEDVFPEIAVAVERLTNPLVIGILRRLVAAYLRRADRVVAIGDTMRLRLEAKGARPERIRVIENWVDTERITPEPRVNAWAREHGLEESFVVMHSGNVGHAADVATLVRAASFLRDVDGLRIVVIGFGAMREQAVALAERLEVGAVTFLPYQPRDVLSESISAAHLHFVGLARGLSGFVVPSRVYGILAAGRPLLVAAEADSETAQLVEREACGIVVPPGRPELVAAAIRAAHAGELDLDEQGTRGRAYVQREADRRVAFGRYRAVLDELLPACSSSER
jgi:glycosyltransferase involved in cell wall biosynthesis